MNRRFGRYIVKRQRMFVFMYDLGGISRRMIFENIVSDIATKLLKAKIKFA